jgi:hypothetical protein
MAAASVPLAKRQVEFREPFTAAIAPSKVRKPSRQSAFNSGVRGGLFEKKHSDAMGESVFLFGWLVTRQTKSDGLVFGGHAFTYPEISEESGWPVRTLERWMARLRTGGYVRVKHTTYCRMIIWVLNPKKFSLSTPPDVADLNASPTPPPVADFTARSGGLKHRSVIGSKKPTPPTPPHAGGTETCFVWCRETVGVFLNGRKRILTDREKEILRGARAIEVVEHLNRKGFRARVIPNRDEGAA